MSIVKGSIELIINGETGGQTACGKTETHPGWPGGASGPLIAIGDV